MFYYYANQRIPFLYEREQTKQKQELGHIMLKNNNK